MQTLELFPPGRALPCVQAGPDLYFSESPRELELAKQLCRPCPLRTRCLEGAKERGEPWGVWGGEVFVDGRPVPFKRSRGRPRKHPLPPLPAKPVLPGANCLCKLDEAAQTLRITTGNSLQDLIDSLDTSLSGQGMVRLNGRQLFCYWRS